MPVLRLTSAHLPRPPQPVSPQSGRSPTSQISDARAELGFGVGESDAFGVGGEGSGASRGPGPPLDVGAVGKIETAQEVQTMMRQLGLEKSRPGTDSEQVVELLGRVRLLLLLLRLPEARLCLRLPTSAADADARTLLQIGLSDYISKMQENEMDIDTLRLLKREDYAELGIPMGVRIRIETELEKVHTDPCCAFLKYSLPLIPCINNTDGRR